MDWRPAPALLALAALLVPAACRTLPPLREADPSARRSLPAGEVIGAVGEYGAHVWRGLPYAEPPTGERRWRAPRPLPRWEGVRAALESGSACPQLASSFGGPRGASVGEPTGNEDCLFLDVYAPRWGQGEVPGHGARVPVMVWIHGGSNVTGTASFYDGGNLAATHGVVVVAINYRLGPLGWLRHAALREGRDALDDSGNYGTLDTIRALHWVQENIGAFGGDPHNITIFGESAGGLDVYSLLLSPLAKGLFQRAVVQSGGLWLATPAESENFADADEPGEAGSSNEALVALRIAEGLAEDRAAAKAWIASTPATELAAWMRSKSPVDWLSAYEANAASEGEGLSDMPTVVRDGVVIPAADPLGVFLRGEHNHVPLVVGTNRDENKLFLFGDDQLVRRWFGLIPQLREPRLYHAGADALSAIWKATGADVPASAIALSQELPVFVYRWDWDEQPVVFGADLSQILGAAHGLEIPFVFGHFDLGDEADVMFTDQNEPGRRELAHAMMSYWSNFAYAGRPGRGRASDLPEWQPWVPSAAPEFLVLDTRADGGIHHELGMLTEQAVVERVVADPRLRDQRERCLVLHALTGWGDFDRSDYATASAEGCAEYPYEDRSWR